jgi:signal transduction histidine kinase/ligand-binding sensor domain-containing protein
MLLWKDPALKWITDLGVAPDGSIWIGMQYRVTRWRRDTGVREYRQEDGLCKSRSERLIVDRLGRVWSGDRTWLSVWSPGSGDRFTCYSGPDARSGIRMLARGDGNRIWVGTYNDLYTFDGEKWTHHPEITNPIAVLQDGNRTWLGSSGSGLWLSEPGQPLRSLNATDHFPCNEVLAIVRGRGESVWVATSGCGAIELHPSALRAWLASDGLTDDPVWSVLPARDGTLWFGTAKGVSFLRDGKFGQMQLGKGRTARIPSLAEDASGRIWLGTESGLEVLQGNGSVRVPLSGKLPAEPLVAQLRDRRGRAWFGFTHGLWRWENGVADPIPDGSVPHISVGPIVEGNDGEIVVGDSRGLTRITSTGPRAIRPGNADFGPVHSLYPDPDGTLWIGTRDEGLAWIDRAGTLHRFGLKQGFEPRGVHAIVDDRRGFLWLNSSNGIFRVSKEDLRNYSRDPSRTAKILGFGTYDGARSPEGSYFSQPGGIRAPDGSLWFATSKGAVRIWPQLAPISFPAPAMLVSGLIVDGHPRGFDAGATLEPGTSRIEISFAPETLSCAPSVRFRYRLSGYDDRWVETGQQRSAIFTRLAPGSYRFEVSASDRNGRWTGPAASFSVTQLPHFWQNWWFGGLCVLGFVGAIQGAYRWRVGQIESRHALVLAERTRVARELHDTLLQELAGASIQLGALTQRVAEDPAGAAGHVKRIREQLSQAVLSTRTSIWELLSVNGRDSLAKQFEDQAGQLTAGAGVSFRFLEEGDRDSVPQALEMPILRAGREIIANAVKHAQAKEIVATLAVDAREVLLEVRDDGIGFDPASPQGAGPEHWGLIGLRERAAYPGGSFELETAPWRGTRVAVRLPLRSEA